MSSTISIQSTQFEKLSEAREKASVERAMAELRTVAPKSEAIPDDTLRPMVADLIARAGEYGLKTERQAFGFVLAAWYMGLDLDTRFPAVQQALSDPKRRPEDKRIWLQDWTVEILRVLEEG